MQIAEIMSRNVDLADPDMKVLDAARKMREGNVGALPVGENDRLVGMVTDRDIVMRGVAGGQLSENTAVRQIMSEGIFYCFEDKPLERAGALMAEHQVHRVPVLNRDKRLVELVALADLVRDGEEGERAALKALKGVSEPTETARR